MRTNPFHCHGFALLALSLIRVYGGWEEKTADLPWLEYHSSRNLGTESLHLFVTDDKLGRLFVGSLDLVVHDGTAWKTYPAGNGAALHTAQFDSQGRLWVGAINEIGYFSKPTPGGFDYQSLLGHLPEAERQVGYIWGVGVVGTHVYFMGREKLFCWDGSKFEVRSFPGLSRLYPLNLDGEPWFHHLETGLYRLTESGPKLEIDPTRLPESGILGIHRTSEGLLLAAGNGFFNAGDSLQRVFSEEANRFVADNRLSSFATLPDGKHIAGTLNGGLIILSPEGRKLRIIDRRDHPGIGVIQAILVRPDGKAWCTSEAGIFLLDPSGEVTVFHERNVLEGSVREIDGRGDELYIISTAGTYRLVTPTGQSAAYLREPLPPWYRSNEAYAGYALALALGVWGAIRFRERRILALNERLEQQVQERTADLVKVIAAKDEFLAGVSHEIRNPMNGVIGIAETLPTAGLDPESRRKFGLLRECANHLSALLEDLLDLSKMQVGIIELKPRPFDLHALVDTAAAMAAGDSAKNRISVEIAISPGVPEQLVGDARCIRQILLNFISNAMKFSVRGKVEVTVWCQPAGNAEQIEVIFAVADEGPGISPEEQVRLFQRFERGAAARGGHVPGTGLGLALCKGYAEKMGGRIWLESEPGRGSCFHFSVPLGLAPESVATGAAPGVPVVPLPRPALVVDDHEYNRIVLVDLLARLGIKAEATADGAEALALAGRRDFGLIFLDYDMPGLSGLEVARGIRALPGGSARASIFATTAFNTPESRRQYLEAGMDFFLGKPVTLERLCKALALAGSAPAPVSPVSPTPSADNLASLRLLAAKKGVSFEKELALYFSELQLELEDLLAAVGRKQSIEAARHAHRLCGRFSFIHERGLEQALRRLDEAVRREKWPEADRLAANLPAPVADLRLRLASTGPAAPPA